MHAYHVQVSTQLKCSNYKKWNATQLLKYICLAYWSNTTILNIEITHRWKSSFKQLNAAERKGHFSDHSFKFFIFEEENSKFCNKSLFLNSYFNELQWMKYKDIWKMCNLNVIVFNFEAISDAKWVLILKTIFALV